MSLLTYRIKEQIKFLENEISRVKELVNESEFDCTTSVYLLVKQYRDAMKKHLKILRMNLDENDFDD